MAVVYYMERAERSMHIEKVLKSRHKGEIKEIYLSSFPKEERMPFGFMLLMSCLWNTKFLAFYDGNTLCGFVYMAVSGKQVFVMFFAVDSKLRSKGYGSRILNEIQGLYPNHKIIVSVEPCNEAAENIEQRIKRKNFYMHNGYQETGYWTRLAGQTQEILIKNGVFDKRRFIVFLMLYSCFAMIPKVWK